MTDLRAAAATAWAHALGILITLLSAAVLILFLLYRHERGAHFEASLRADSTAAANDTSKLLTNPKLQKVLGDSTNAWQRRTVQEKQRADSLDKVLGTERKSLTTIGVTIDRGTGKASGAVHTVYVPVAGAPPSEIRQAHFDVKAGVFNVAADVSLAAPPSVGTMEATVIAPKIPLSLRLSCGPVTDGVHRADAVVTGPRWATVGIDHTEADPAVCNPTMRLSRREYPLWAVVATDLLSAAAGYWVGSHLATKQQQTVVVTK